MIDESREDDNMEESIEGSPSNDMGNAKDENRVSFDGTGGQLFGVILVNILLTIVTFGIYYFWGVVKVRKFFHNQTSILGGRFDYHVTGGEKFKAFLKAIVLLGIVFALLYGIAVLIAMTGLPLPQGTIMLILFYIFLLFMGPLILVAARRFTMSRTSWNSIHFKFTGRIKEAVKLYLKGVFFTIITLGLYSPWFIVSIYGFLMNSTYLGNAKFKYTGTGRGLSKYYWILYGIIILFYAFIGAYVYFVTQMMADGGVLNPGEVPNLGEFPISIMILSIGMFILGILVFVAIIWYTVKQYKYHWENTSLNGYAFKCNIKVGQMIGLQIAAGFITMFTLGIAFPWAIIMMQKYMLETISLEGDVDLHSIIATPDDQESSAFAEAVEEAGGFLESVADFIV